MIIIQNYVRQSEMFITTLSHEQVEEVFLSERCSAFIPGNNNNQITHWVAEPSAIREIEGFCNLHGHLFQSVVNKQQDKKPPIKGANNF